MLYKKQRNVLTGETRLIPVSQEERPKAGIGEQLRKVPIIGGAMGNIADLGSMIGEGIAAPMANKEAAFQSGIASQSALDLAKAAATETDPAKKQALLQKSREAGSTAMRITGANLEERSKAMGGYAEPKTTLDKFKTYGGVSAKAGLSAAELLLAPRQIKAAGQATKTYVKNIASQKSVLGKIQALSPFRQNVINASTKQAVAANTAPGKFSQSQAFKDTLETLKGTGDTAAKNKAIEKFGFDLAKKDIDFLKKLPPEEASKYADVVFKDSPWKQALVSRKEFGKATQWPTWIEKLLQSTGIDNSDQRALQAMYKAYNTQLKTVKGIAEADKTIVRNLWIDGVLKAIIGEEVIRKSVPSVLSPILNK